MDISRFDEWATVTGSAFRCLAHKTPNPFCACVGRNMIPDPFHKGKKPAVLVTYHDGLWLERQAAEQAARRSFHDWLDGQRPEKVAAKTSFLAAMRARKEAVKAYKAWGKQAGADGFVRFSGFSN